MSKLDMDKREDRQKHYIKKHYEHQFKHNPFVKKTKDAMGAALNAKVKDEIPKGLRRKA